MSQDIVPLVYLKHFLPPYRLVFPFSFCPDAIILILAGVLQHNAKSGSNIVILN